MIFTATAFFDWVLPGGRPTISRRTGFHLTKALEHLRKRLTIEPDIGYLPDTTISVVIALAYHSYLMGDSQSCSSHMGGPYKIVTLRGGLASFSEKPKLVVEILRHDTVYQIPNRDED